ncbi:uncharacterized protein LOC113679477 [Pocillopora damicornis]|uniref:uncharacterized protein LOC113679477 n=1 Tax=Pocillopora damicornis TaxID=46731 RepID=UPI000F553105|nr:uncharacterized protein LOC113679477 [Pocillopora damicornis]
MSLLRNNIMKVLICLTLVALLCCTVEGKKSKKGPKIQKQEGEPCSLPSGIPWGDCFQAVNCPSSPSLNCADGLRCCRPPKEDSKYIYNFFKGIFTTPGPPINPG